jgi:hypothetical protein
MFLTADSLQQISPKNNKLKAPGISRVATLANREVVTAERTLPVMAGNTTLPPARGMVIGCFWSRNLSTLRNAGSHLMTIIATELLGSSMLRMAETHTKRAGP